MKNSHSESYAAAGVDVTAGYESVDAHFLRIEHAADDGHAKAGVIHIGVAADIDEVALVPATRIHVGAADGEELVAARSPGA